MYGQHSQPAQLAASNQLWMPTASMTGQYQIWPHTYGGDKDLRTHASLVSMSPLSEQAMAKSVHIRLAATNDVGTYRLGSRSCPAYIKGHSTETTLLSVHDHIIKTMSLQQVACLTLFD